MLGMDYNIGVKHSYRGRHFILLSVLIRKVVQVTYTMERSSPFVRDTRSLSFPTCTRNGHRQRVANTRGCIDTIDCPDDEHEVARNM